MRTVGLIYDVANSMKEKYSTSMKCLLVSCISTTGKKISAHLQLVTLLKYFNSMLRTQEFELI
jgi:hypothetical protein